MKTNYYILIALFVFYIIVDVYLVIKIIKIKKYPQDYVEAELTQKANELESSRKHFRCFKSLSQQYSMVSLIFFILLDIVGFLLVYLCSVVNTGGKTGVFLGTAYIGACALMFINIPLAMAIIPLHIKTGFFAVSLLSAFNCEGRDKIHFRAYLMFAILFIAGFPFVIGSCNSYACYDEKGIYYSAYFQLNEIYTPYEDIENVNISIQHNSNGQVDVFEYYVELDNGKKVNINNPNTGCKYFTENVYNIHKYLELNKNCVFNITPLNDVDKKFIQSKLSEERAEIAYYIFGCAADK